MTDTRPLIPVWYVGDGVTEPTRTFIHEGAEYPETDTDGHKLYNRHHFEHWQDAVDNMESAALCVLDWRTDSLVDSEEAVLRCQKAVADSAKNLRRLRQLEEPTE